MNLDLVLILIPLSLAIVSISLAYLFSSAFNSVSRNTDSSSYIGTNLLIGAGFIEFLAILIIGIFGALYTKL